MTEQDFDWGLPKGWAVKEVDGSYILRNPVGENIIHLPNDIPKERVRQLFQDGAVDYIRVVSLDNRSAAIDFCATFTADQLQGTTLREVVNVMRHIHDHLDLTADAYDEKYGAGDENHAENDPIEALEAILAKFQPEPSTPECPVCGKPQTLGEEFHRTVCTRGTLAPREPEPVCATCGGSGEYKLMDQRGVIEDHDCLDCAEATS